MTALESLQTQLEERLEFESLLLELSARFVSLSSESLDDVIEDTQRRICLALSLDRSTLFQFNEAENTVLTTHSWAREGMEPAPLIRVDILYPYALQCVLSGNIFQFTTLDDLPDEAVVDKQNLPLVGLKSNITFPLMVGGTFIGAIAFDTLQAERTWPSHLVSRFRLISEIIANALARRRTENALRESEERLELATSAAGVGLWSMDQTTRQLWLSPDMYKLFPLPEGTGTAEQFYEIIHPEDRVLFQQLIPQALKDQRPFRIDFRTMWPDGSIRWISSRGRLRFDPIRRRSYLMGSCTDVTDRKNAEMESRRHSRELAHMNRVSSMGELATSLAHELNQPLGAILRNAESAELLLMSENPDLEELRAIVTDIRHDDERAGNVIDRLRILLKRHDIDLRPTDFALLVQECIVLLQSEAQDRRVRLAVDIGANLPLVQADAVHLQQVLINLVMNSMDAMSDEIRHYNRHVTIWARSLEQDSLVEVNVSDTGPGIFQQPITDIFEPFFTTKPSGMGMGLPISKTIIEAHGGKIWARNNKEGGATLTFTLMKAAGGDHI